MGLPSSCHFEKCAHPQPESELERTTRACFSLFVFSLVGTLTFWTFLKYNSQAYYSHGNVPLLIMKSLLRVHKIVDYAKTIIFYFRLYSGMRVDNGSHN